MISVSLYLDKRSVSKRNDNGYPVKLVLYDSSSKKQKQFSTGFYQKGKKLKLTQELSQLLQTYQERVTYCTKLNLVFKEAVGIVKNGFNDKEKELLFLRRRIDVLEKREKVGLVQFTQGIIHERELAEKSTRHFKEALNQLDKFVGEQIDINDISYDFLKQFEAFKRTNSKGNGSGISKTIRTLRTIYNEARRRGLLHDNQNNPFEGFIVNIKKNAIKEVWKIEDLKSLLDFQPKPSTSYANRYKMRRSLDIFLFQIAIGGHDMADLANLKWSNIETGRIKFQRFKLRSHSSRLWINNMISPFAASIIEKYGDRNDARIFSFLFEPSTERYRMQNNYQLRTLKRISQTINIPDIKTKSPRYIFRSLGGMIGVNDLLLMQIMGHKPNSTSFRYQYNLSLEAQDNAHNEVLSLLFKD